MQIQMKDFPSDILGETGKLREELTKSLQKAAVSDSAAKVLSDIIKFTIGKIKEADAYRKDKEAFKMKVETGEDAASSVTGGDVLSEQDEKEEDK